MISDDRGEIGVEEVLQERVSGDRYEDKDQVVHSCPGRSIAKPASVFGLEDVASFVSLPVC